MTTVQPDKIVYIGRFRPAHKAHIETVERACMIAKDRVIIIVGSANQPRTIKNPWKWDEVADMIRASLTPSALEKVVILPARDILYNDSAWEQSIQEIVGSVTEETDVVNIIGYTKDETSYYINAFPQWKTIEMENIEDLHATDIRNAMFENKDFASEIGTYLPKGIHDYIQSFMLTPEYDKLVKEYQFQLSHDRMWDMNKMLDYFKEQEIDNYPPTVWYDDILPTLELLQTKYKVAPYEPTFNTVDVVMIMSGHVLLIQRKAEPGKNLYAMPGGYLNTNEWSEEGGIRELKEETKIKVPVAVLRGNIKVSKTYDDPSRSTRGRIITQVFGIKLPAGELPKVTAADDAKRVQWVPLSVFAKMEDQMFEDHYALINDILGKM